MSEISEKAIKLIKDLRRDISIDIMFTPTKNAEDESLKALVDYIAELEEKQRWIPVSERLPEKQSEGECTDDVLTISSSGYTTAYYDYADECWVSMFTAEVTHWMPLPQPPEVQE